MLRLNKENRTLTGEILKPYLVENGNIYCWNRIGKTVVKKLEDFNTTASSEKLIGGTSIKQVTPIYRKTPIVVSIPEEMVPVIEQEIIEQEIIEQEIIEQEIPSVIDNVVISTPIIEEDEKIVYVYVKPAIDNYLGDGEMQKGGVEIVTPEEAEGRTEFNPIVEDEDYI